MDLRIAFAEPADEVDLKGILTDTGMDLAGEIEEHVVLKNGHEILAGGRLYQADEDLFHLLVFAVAKEERGRGTGRRLLQEFSARPWEYCRDAVEPAGSYRITTVAKGEAATFYTKGDFQVCDVSVLPVPFDRQCEDCPDRKRCNPVPLVFSAPSRNQQQARG